MLKGKVSVIAHRGYSAKYLENSLEAISHALNTEAHMIEIDLRLTRDKYLIAMHDPTTGRTATENVKVEQTDLKELKAIPLKNGETIPTIGEILKIVRGKIALNIELKGKGTGSALGEYLRNNPYYGELLISSYRREELADFSAYLPETPTARIYWWPRIRDIMQDAEIGHYSIHIHHMMVSRWVVDLAHRCGLKVLAFTTDYPSEILRLTQIGVDGIFTNDPPSASSLIGNANL